MGKDFFQKRKLRYIKEDLKIKNNCINCFYYVDNKCDWWFFYRKIESKEIHNNILNKGCRFWRDKADKFHPLIKEIIKRFDGELIE